VARRHGRSHQASIHEVGKPVCRGIDGDQASDWTASIGHDDFIALSDAFEIAAEVVLEVADSDTGRRCSYIHADSVATPWDTECQMTLPHRDPAGWASLALPPLRNALP
jgi:hypothetical protein